MSVMIFSDNVPVDARARDQAGGRRARPHRHGARLRHGDRQRHPAGVRERRAPRADRRRRRLGHRHAGGHGAHPRARLRRVAGDRHRRPRPRRGDRRHLDAARRCAGSRTTPSTKVVVLVSKPPHPTVAAAVLAQAAAHGDAGRVDLPRRGPRRRRPDGIVAAGNLAEAADLAVALAEGRPAERAGLDVGDAARAPLDEIVARRGGASSASSAGSSRAGRSASRPSSSSAPAASTPGRTRRSQGNATLADIATSAEHTIIDMGDDQFTQGRPHPMIDPGLRDERLAQEAADPTTAVLLVDVVLGYGSTMDPVSGLVAVLARAQADAAADGRRLAAIVHVCGTSADPQGRAERRRRAARRQARSSPRRTPRRPRGRPTSRPGWPPDDRSVHPRPATSPTSGCRTSPTTSARPAAAPSSSPGARRAAATPKPACGSRGCSQTRGSRRRTPPR